MHKSKLIHFLQKLDNRDWRKWEEYLHSPFHNKSEQMKRFFEILRSYHPKYEHPNLSKKAVFQSMFPKRTYKESRIKNLMSQGFQLLESFLIQLEFQKDEMYQKRLLLNYLKDTEDKKFFEKIRDDFRDEVENLPYKENTYYEISEFLEETSYVYTMTHQNRSVDVNLEDTLKMLDVSYLLKRLQLTCSNIYKESEVGYQEEELLYLLNQFQNRFQDVPLLNIYHRLLKLLMEQAGENDYLLLKAILNQHRKSISNAQARDIYALLLNYQITQMQVKSSSWDEVLHLYDKMLEERLLLEGDAFLGSEHFNNIVYINLLQGYKEKAQTFLSNYIEYIRPDIREDVKNYNLARIFFYQNRYGESIRLMNKVKFLDPYYYFQAKQILLMCYYEEDDLRSLEAAEYTANAFIRSAQREAGISQQQEVRFTKFARFYKKLVRLKTAKLLGKNQLTRINIPKFKESIIHSASIQKKWLIEKLREFD